jgi:hypothetical protein
LSDLDATSVSSSTIDNVWLATAQANTIAPTTEGEGKPAERLPVDHAIHSEAADRSGWHFAFDQGRSAISIAPQLASWAETPHDRLTPSGSGDQHLPMVHVGHDQFVFASPPSGTSTQRASPDVGTELENTSRPFAAEGHVNPPQAQPDSDPLLSLEDGHALMLRGGVSANLHDFILHA